MAVELAAIVAPSYFIAVSPEPVATMVSATPRILLSDDDAAFRAVLAESLGCRGYEVTATGDGGQAIEAWDNGRGQFDLCLVDFHMPRANGIEVIRHVQSTGPVSAVCLLMSAEMDDAIEAAAMAAHAYRVLTKPLRLKVLTEALRRALIDTGRL